MKVTDENWGITEQPDGSILDADTGAELVPDFSGVWPSDKEAGCERPSYKGETLPWDRHEGFAVARGAALRAAR